MNADGKIDSGEWGSWGIRGVNTNGQVYGCGGDTVRGNGGMELLVLDKYLAAIIE